MPGDWERTPPHTIREVTRHGKAMWFCVACGAGFGTRADANVHVERQQDLPPLRGLPLTKDAVERTLAGVDGPALVEDFDRVVAHWDDASGLTRMRDGLQELIADGVVVVDDGCYRIATHREREAHQRRALLDIHKGTG